LEIKPLEYVYNKEKGKVVKKVEINGVPYECDEPGVLYVDKPRVITKYLP